MFIHCFSLSATLYTYIWIVCSVHANGLCNRIAFRSSASLSLILFFSDYLRLYFSISYYLIIPILVICNLFFSSSFHQLPHSHIRLFSLSPILLFFASSVSFSLSLHSTLVYHLMLYMRNTFEDLLVEFRIGKNHYLNLLCCIQNKRIQN